MIEARDISKTYLLGETVVTALSHINLHIEKGSFSALSGPSGSGKSTLLNILGSVEKPTSGNVFVEGENVTQLPADKQAYWRAHHLGFIFQTFNLLPVLTAFENVEYPLDLIQVPEQERRERVTTLMTQVGLESHIHHQPSQLSGGQRQRVAIARALAVSPTLILADEPTANLDHKTGVEIIQLLKSLNKSQGVTLVISSHDPSVIKEADTVFTLDSGTLVASA